MYLIKILFVIAIAIFILISIAQMFKPKLRKFSYRNSATVLGSNNICIQQDSNLNLKVLDDKHIIVNDEEIFIPRKIRNVDENFQIEQYGDNIFINGFRYDFITKKFEV